MNNTDNKKPYGIIYKIQNKINNKIYIGQTVNTFDRRYKNNLEKYTNNQHLKKSINKYGIDNFDIIKVYDVAYSKEELDQKEIYYINLYDTMNPSKGYNKNTGGHNGRHSQEIINKIKLANTGKKRTEETKKLLSVKAKLRPKEKHPMLNKKHSEETKKKIGLKSKGRKHSKESREKMSISRQGEKNHFYGKKHTPETIQKIKDANTGDKSHFYGKTGAEHPKSIKIVMLNKNDNSFIKLFNGLSEAKRELNAKCTSSIIRVCKGTQKTAYGYKWAYYDDYIKEHPEILKTAI